MEFNAQISESTGNEMSGSYGVGSGMCQGDTGQFSLVKDG